MRRIAKKKRDTEGEGFYLAQYFCPPSLKARAGTRLLGPPAVHISFATVRSALKPPRKRESFEETTLHFIRGHLRRTPGGRSELLVSSLLESFFSFLFYCFRLFSFLPIYLAVLSLFPVSGAAAHSPFVSGVFCLFGLFCFRTCRCCPINQLVTL